MRYLGFDIGGTAIKGGLVDETGRVLESHRAPTIVNDLDGFLSKLTELIREFEKAAPIDAIGIGVPGLRSSKTHIIETSPNIPCLTKINLEQRVADQVHFRVVSENDATAAAKSYAFPSSFADCQIVQSKLRPDAGMIGAAMLARD